MPTPFSQWPKNSRINHTTNSLTSFLPLTPSSFMNIVKVGVWCYRQSLLKDWKTNSSQTAHFFGRSVPCKPRLIGGVEGHKMKETSSPETPALPGPSWRGGRGASVLLSESFDWPTLIKFVYSKSTNHNQQSTIIGVAVKIFPRFQEKGLGSEGNFREI
jgi:hypothetical protein